MTPGSTVSNLTALWAARELRGVLARARSQCRVVPPRIHVIPDSLTLGA
jgi:hypothetical protein